MDRARPADRVLSASPTEPKVSAHSGDAPSRDDTQLVEHAVRVARPRYRSSAPRWVAVMDVFEVGRTSAIELCVRFGFDPDEKRVRR
jgi:hypothetical protein